jgi:Ca-activated chloride channel homolog
MRFSQRALKLRSISLVLTCFMTVMAQAQTSVPQAASAQQQLVKVNVLVTDASDQPVGDVRQEKFRVFENDVPQTISFFSKEELPLIYGVAVDNSASFKPVLEPVIKAAQSLVNQNRPGDETFIVRFIDGDKIETMNDFTSDKGVLSKSLDGMYIEGGQTALIDAIYLTAQRIAKYKRDDSVNRRRAIVLFTDGEDRSSYYKKDDLIELLRRENIQIFILGMVSVLSDDSPSQVSARQRAKYRLNSLAKESGGFVFYPKGATELQNVAERLMIYLRTQYLIGYVPAGQTKQKAFHKVEVKLADTPERKKLAVATRAGYIVSLPGDKKPK